MPRKVNDSPSFGKRCPRAGQGTLLPDKTPCRAAHRYVNQLDPSLLSDPWTIEEDRTIVKFQVRVCRFDSRQTEFVLPSETTRAWLSLQDLMLWGSCLNTGMLPNNYSCRRKNWVTLGPTSRGFFPEGERLIYIFSMGLRVVHSRAASLTM
jgi:hypothetical protein